MTNERKILRGLSYISVIFAPILFPILVWIFTPQGSVTRDTAKHALWLHIIPTLLSIFIFMDHWRCRFLHEQHQRNIRRFTYLATCCHGR